MTAEPIAIPVSIPLSTHQQALFDQIEQGIQELASRRASMVTALVAGHLDPAVAQGMDITIQGPAIVCTPRMGQAESGSVVRELALVGTE